MFGVRVYDAKPQWRVMMAQLLAADGERYVLPMLDHARLLRVRGQGLLIGGQEVIPLSRGRKNIRTARYAQAWWCLPIALGSQAQVSRTPAGATPTSVDELQNHEKRVFRASANDPDT